MQPGRSNEILQKSTIGGCSELARGLFFLPYIQRICSNKKDNEECMLSTLKPFLYDGADFLDTVS